MLPPSYILNLGEEVGVEVGIVHYEERLDSIVIIVLLSDLEVAYLFTVERNR